MNQTVVRSGAESREEVRILSVVAVFVVPMRISHQRAVPSESAAPGPGGPGAGCSSARSRLGAPRGRASNRTREPNPLDEPNKCPIMNSNIRSKASLAPRIRSRARALAHAGQEASMSTTKCRSAMRAQGGRGLAAPSTRGSRSQQLSAQGSSAQAPSIQGPSIQGRCAQGHLAAARCDSRGPRARPNQPKNPGSPQRPAGPSLVRIDLWGSPAAVPAGTAAAEMASFVVPTDDLPTSGGPMAGTPRGTLPAGSRVPASASRTRAVPSSGSGWYLTTRGLAVVMAFFAACMAVGVAAVVYSLVGIGDTGQQSPQPAAVAAPGPSGSWTADDAQVSQS